MKYIVEVKYTNPAHEHVSLRRRVDTIKRVVEARSEAEAINRVANQQRSLGFFIKEAFIVKPKEVMNEGFDANPKAIAKMLVDKHGKNVTKKHIDDLEQSRDSHSGLDHEEIMKHVQKMTEEASKEGEGVMRGMRASLKSMDLRHGVDSDKRDAGYKVPSHIKAAQAKSDALSKVVKRPQAGTLAAMKKEEVEYIEEKLTAGDPASKWIHDFVHSDNPKFEGKSKKERISMALGAKYAANRAVKEEAEQIDERNKENADRRKMMDAEKGAEFKSQGHHTPEPTSKQNDDEAHSKMVGRAIRKMTREEVEQIDERNQENAESKRKVMRQAGVQASIAGKVPFVGSALQMGRVAAKKLPSKGLAKAYRELPHPAPRVTEEVESVEEANMRFDPEAAARPKASDVKNFLNRDTNSRAAAASKKYIRRMTKLGGLGPNQTKKDTEAHMKAHFEEVEQTDEARKMSRAEWRIGTESEVDKNNKRIYDRLAKENPEKAAAFHDNLAKLKGKDNAKKAADPGATKVVNKKVETEAKPESQADIKLNAKIPSKYLRNKHVKIHPEMTMSPDKMKRM